MRRLGVLAVVCASCLSAGCGTVLLGIANGADLPNGGYRRLANVAYGELPRQRLDIYRPALSPAARRPVIVFVHGGRWSSGSKDQYRFVAAGLAERGFVVYVPNYRLYPKVRMTAAAGDVARAVVYAERSAAGHGGDPGRIVVMGHSAGAQLAALVACDPRWLGEAGGAPVSALVGFAGPYDFLPLTDADLIDYFGPPALYPASQPVNFVGSGSPPAFLVHGLADTTVKIRNTLSFAGHLEAAGVAVTTRLVPAERHGEVLRHFARFYRGADALYAELLRFLADPPPRAPAG